MALSAATVWECRQAAADTNGGGFVTGASGVDYSQQNAAQYALTGIATAGAGAVFLSASAAADMVGNILQVVSGTNFTTGFFEILSVVVGVSVTVDRNITTGVGASGVINIGGALKSPALASSVATVAGHIIFAKYNATPFSMTSASTNVANGCPSLTAGTFMIGYDTTRTTVNTDPNRPTFQSNVTTATILNAAGTNAVSAYVNIILDGNGQTAARSSGSNCTLIRCHISGFNTASNGLYFFNCSATLNSAAPFVGTSYFCEAYANTATPFSAGLGGSLTGCLSYANTGATTDGFSFLAACQANGCVAYNNGRHGFIAATAARSYNWMNCIAVNNAGFGFTWGTGASSNNSFNNAAYNNTSGANSGTVNYSFGFITLSGDPFVNAAGGNFALNFSAGAGASLLGVGFSVTLPAGITSNYRDVGAAQHRNLGVSLIGNGLVG